MGMPSGVDLISAGKPMVWYSRHALGFAMYLPSGVAGALLPYLMSNLTARDALLGAALLLGSIASLLTSAGLCATLPPVVSCSTAIIIHL